MKHQFFLTTVVALTLLLTAQVILGANPADLTSDYRVNNAVIYKIGYDGEPYFSRLNIPYCATGNILLFGSQGNKAQFYKIIAVKSLLPILDVALEANFDSAGLKQSLAFDSHWRNVGLGLVSPLKPSSDGLAISPRLEIKGFRLFFSAKPLAEKPGSLYGITYGNWRGFTPEIAYGSDTLFFRLSYVLKTDYGKLCPQFRTKFTKEKSTIGFALGFIPKG